MGGFLVREEMPARAEAVVVLAGDDSGNRILKAAELVKQGYAPRVFVSGPSGHYGTSEDILAIDFAVKHGYPREWFIGVPNGTRSTRDEADAMLPALRARSIRGFILVTSDYHTRRAGMIFREKAADMLMRVVAAPDVYFRPDGWWREREGRKVFLLEATKLATSVFGI